MEYLSAILGGAFGAAIVTVIGKLLENRQLAKLKKEDTETEDMKTVKTALKYLMYDRIRYLGTKYVSEGEVDFDDRRILNEMHRSYHDGLDGNVGVVEPSSGFDRAYFNCHL